jgi:hypothetical protein
MNSAVTLPTHMHHEIMITTGINDCFGSHIAVRDTMFDEFTDHLTQCSTIVL